MADYAAAYRDMKVLDGNLEWFGYSVMQAMEKAGKGIARHVTRRFGHRKKIAIFTGSGNKGGDGFVAARYLALANDVHVFLVAQPKTKEAKANLERIRKKGGIRIHAIGNARFPQERFDIYIDALVGLGFTGKLREPVKSTVKWLNRQKGKKVAVDLPTGHETKTAFRAELVLSTHNAKTKNAVAMDIGIPKKMEHFIGPGQVKALRLNRGQTKGQNGVLTVIGGSKQYHGAPLYAILAAAPFVDLVFFHSPEKDNQWIARQLKPKSRAFSTVDAGKDLEAVVRKSDCVLVGPGLEENAADQELVNGLLRKFPKKKFALDAGAMMLADKRLFKNRAVLTPHAGEFKRCFGVAATEKNAKAAAKKHTCVVLLKGRVDIVTDGERLFRNFTGNKGMTRGGTGDVLAGLVSALATQNELFLSAQAGAFLNGLAGDTVAEKHLAFTAEDVAKALPAALEKARRA